MKVDGYRKESISKYNYILHGQMFACKKRDGLEEKPSPGIGGKMRNTKTTELVLTALFAAIIIIMAFTPLGYIPLVIINATIIHIPVILGALFCGPKKGGFFGFVFGLTSFIKNTVMPSSLSAFVFSPVLAASMVGTSGIFRVHSSVLYREFLWESCHIMFTLE